MIIDGYMAELLINRAIGGTTLEESVKALQDVFVDHDPAEKGEPMSDLIDRQAAIDKIAHATFDVTIGGRRGFIDYKKEFEKAFVAIRDKYIEALESIPSAGSDIVCCEDCKYADEKPIADGRHWCELYGSFMYYCSDAERKKES